jgi:hypothetical protein
MQKLISFLIRIAIFVGMIFLAIMIGSIGGTLFQKFEASYFIGSLVAVFSGFISTFIILVITRKKTGQIITINSIANLVFFLFVCQSFFKGSDNNNDPIIGAGMPLVLVLLYGCALFFIRRKSIPKSE